MTQDSIDYERLKSLYLQGHVQPGVVPHVKFEIDLDHYKGAGNEMSLLGALGREIARIDRQVHQTGSPRGPTVAVYQQVGSVLHIRAAVVDVPKPPDGDDLPQDHPIDPPTPPQRPTQPPLTNPPGPGADLSAHLDADEPEGRSPEPPPPPSSESDGGQTAERRQELFEAAAWRTRDILMLHKEGKLKTFEALTGQINEGPLPDKIKHWLVTVERHWRPWETARGLLDWEGLKPIVGYFPSRLTAVLDAEVYKIDSTNRTASLLLKRLHTKEHAKLLAAFGTRRRPYVPVSIATAELADLLAFYRGIGLPVRLSLAVQFSLVDTKKPELLVTLTCPVETSPEAIKAAVDAKLALVLNRPKQLSLLDAPASS